MPRSILCKTHQRVELAVDLDELLVPLRRRGTLDPVFDKLGLFVAVVVVVIGVVEPDEGPFGVLPLVGRNHVACENMNKIRTYTHYGL